jgi:hypothetical protein
VLQILEQLLLVPLFVSAADNEKQPGLQAQDLVERLHVVETLAALLLLVAVDWEDRHPHCFMYIIHNMLTLNSIAVEVVH